MAWRAMLRRCRFMDQCINIPNTPIPNSHSFSRGFSTHNFGEASLLKDNPLKFSVLGLLKSRSFGVRNWDLNAPIGLRWIHQAQKVRPFSTASAKPAEHRREVVFSKAVEGSATAKGGKKSQEDTVKEVQNSCSGEVRRGASVSNEDILGFAKLFNDELTLDNLSRPHLVKMCKHMGISPFGTDAYLCYMLMKRLQRIKEDDRLIQAEGVDSLSEAELRDYCRERGMLGLLSVEEMRQQLQHWLDLSLNHSVPSSLLILSRAFTLSGRMKPEETVHATFLPFEDSISERRRKLEVLEVQEELIKEVDEKEGAKQARMEINSDQDDKALKEMNISSAKEAHKLARARAVENQEQLCELRRALSVLASASSVSTEREGFLRLVNEEIEHYNMVEKQATNCEKETFKPCKVAREDHEHSFGSGDGDKVSTALREKADAMLQNLKKEMDDVDTRIGVHWRLLDRDYDTKVTLEEVESAVMYVKDTLGKVGIDELMSSLSKGYEFKEKDLESEELNEGFKHEGKDLEFKELNEGLEHEKKDLESIEFTVDYGNEEKDLEYEEFSVDYGYDEKDLESEESLRDLYDKFIARHQREFHDLYEKEARFNIFKNNVKHIHEVNQKNLSYKMGVNQFTDWTWDEYKRILCPFN